MKKGTSRGEFETVTAGQPMTKGVGDSLGVDTSGWSRGTFERVTVGHKMVRGKRGQTLGGVHDVLRRTVEESFELIMKQLGDSKSLGANAAEIEAMGRVSYRRRER